MRLLVRLVLSNLLFAFLAIPASANGRTFVVMLFDGFSPQYIEAFDTPTFDRLQQEGAYTHAMDQAFPTISLIGGFTISTGCWPEHHGIVSNLFIDPERGRYDHSRDNDWMTGCEHLHQAAERQGVPSAALGWYGRTSTTNGTLASIVSHESGWQDYPDDLGRADQVVALLDEPPGERPRLILSYYKGPDAAGHFTGMDSEETRAAVEMADAAVARVLRAIEAQPDAENIHLLVTTDHGMLPVEYLVNIQRVLRRQDIEATAVSTGTSSFLYFDDPSEETLADAMAKLGTYEEFDVYRRDAQPENWHIGTGPRVGDLIISAKPPYFIEDPDSWPWYISFLKYVGPDFIPSERSLKATHGYPAETPGVEAILYTWGSAFAEGREVERVRAIDIHPTVMHVLDLEPGNPVDGAVEARLLR